MEVRTKDRHSSRPWVEGKKPVRVPIVRIRPTNTMHSDVAESKYSPILLVKGADHSYYIVDGNHRFFRMLFLRRRSGRRGKEPSLPETIDT